MRSILYEPDNSEDAGRLDAAVRDSARAQRALELLMAGAVTLASELEDNVREVSDAIEKLRRRQLPQR